MVRVFPNKNFMFYIVAKILGNENILFNKISLSPKSLVFSRVQGINELSK